MAAGALSPSVAADQGSPWAGADLQVLLLRDRKTVSPEITAQFEGKQVSHWGLRVVDEVSAAKQDLASGPVDVIMADVSVPASHPVVESLFKWARDHCPGTVRVALSSRSEPLGVFEALRIAHQMLPVPLHLNDFLDALRRIEFLRMLMTNASLQDVVGDIGALPAVPRLYSELTRALADPMTDMRRVGAIVQQDPAISAKLLQLVNSAFFGLSRKISGIDDATVLLGIGVVRQLALLSEVAAAYEGRIDLGELSLDQLQLRAFKAATLASRLVKDPTHGSDIYSAALLHGVGRLVFAGCFPKENAAIAEEVKRQGGRHRHTLEIEACSVSHAELGAYLLGIWGLPMPVVEAVAFHHSPDVLQRPGLDVTGVVHIASHLVADHFVGDLSPVNDVVDGDHGSLDVGYLARLGVLKKLPKWRLLAHEVMTNG